MAKKKKSRINQMRYGEMNFLGSAYGKSTFDPSRVDIISVLQGSNTDYYTANVIAGKRRWNAIVLRSTQQTHATVSSEFQRSYTVFERGNEDGEFVHFTYKIYIAELDGFKKIPEKFSSNSEDAGLVNLCRDALAPLGQSYGKIDYGTPVEVVFADQEKLRHPTIVDVHWNRRISLQSGVQPLWTTSGPRVTVASPHEGALPEDTGPPIPGRAGQVRNGKAFYDDLGRAGIECEALRHGILVNVKNESRFDPSVPGDSIQRLGAPGKPGGIKTDYPGNPDAPWPKLPTKLYASYGLFQMNIGRSDALGWQMLEYYNLTDADNDAKLDILTGEKGYDKQIEFMVHKLETNYPSVLDCSRYKTSQQYHDFWLEQIENPSKTEAIGHRNRRKGLFKRTLRGLGFEPIE